MSKEEKETSNMMRLENWYLTTCNINVCLEHKKIIRTELITKEMIDNPNLDIPKDQNGKAIYLVGEVYGRPGFAEGKKIVTSTVKEIEADEAVTYSGSKYKLGKKHKHYEIFCERISENKPVMFNWHIGKLRASKSKDFKNFKNKVCVSANVYIDGKMTYVFGEAENLDLENFTVEVEGIEYYISWISWYFEARMFSHQEANILIPRSIENHHFFKCIEENEDECFLGDTYLGDPWDVIGKKNSTEREYLPMLEKWIMDQRENILFAPEK